MRIFDIIKSEINTDKLKLEEELERVINNKTIDTTERVHKIKTILREIAIAELSFKKFESLIPNDSENNEENNEEKNEE